MFQLEKKLRKILETFYIEEREALIHELIELIEPIYENSEKYKSLQD